ncbi:MAG: hypothetical protein ACE5H2_10400, partial [Terriglobia bacterium]
KVHGWVRWGRGAWRAALGVFFAAVLMIPRVGRLRRRVRLWTMMRAVALAGGGWLGWQFIQGKVGAGALALSLVLLVFGLAVGAQRERKSVDAEARARGALVVLHGGTYVAVGDSRPTRAVRIFVNPERLEVLDSRQRPLLEIPLSGVCSVRVEATKAAQAGWRLLIEWHHGRAEFRYEGYFGEHLARVAEETICGVWKKELPVCKA